MDALKSFSRRESGIEPTAPRQVPPHQSPTVVLPHAQQSLIVTKGPRSCLGYDFNENNSFHIIELPSSSGVEITQEITFEDDIQASLQVHSGADDSECTTDCRDTIDLREPCLDDHTTETFGVHDSDLMFLGEGVNIPLTSDINFGGKLPGDHECGDIVQLKAVESPRPTPIFKDPLEYSNTLSKERSIPELPWTPRTSSVTYKPIVSVTNEKHGQEIVTLESAPSLTDDLSSRDSEQNLHCFDILVNNELWKNFAGGLNEARLSPVPWEASGPPDRFPKPGVVAPVQPGYLTNREWNNIKPVFTKLYITEDRPLKEVQNILERDHGFVAT